MVVIFRVAVPLFASVSDCAPRVVLSTWLVKVKLVGVKVTAGAGFVPVPVRLTECGLPAALSVIVIAPVRVPADAGVKVTLIEQFAFAVNVLPQVVVSE